MWTDTSGIFHSTRGLFVSNDMAISTVARYFRGKGTQCMIPSGRYNSEFSRSKAWSFMLWTTLMRVQARNLNNYLIKVYYTDFKCKDVEKAREARNFALRSSLACHKWHQPLMEKQEPE